jgi:hypothetical protein
VKIYLLFLFVLILLEVVEFVFFFEEVYQGYAIASLGYVLFAFLLLLAKVISSCGKLILVALI